MSCGRIYIGQPGRYFNERTREHSISARINLGGHLAKQCKRRGCEQLLKMTKFLKRAKCRTKQKITETFFFFLLGRLDTNAVMPPVCLIHKDAFFS